MKLILILGLSVAITVAKDMKIVFSGTYPYIPYDPKEHSILPRQEVIISILLYEIPYIFKHAGKKYTVFSEFREICLSLQELKPKPNGKLSKIDYTLFQKRIRIFNKLLNIIKMSLHTDQHSNSDIMAKRAAIADIPFFSAPLVTSPKKFTYNIEEDEKTTEGCGRFNYDTSEVLEYQHKLKVRSSVDMSETRKLQGLLFGFDTKDQVLQMLLVAIEQATVTQLECENEIGDEIETIKHGCLIYRPSLTSLTSLTFYRLSLKLKIQHSISKGIIESYSTKILHILSTNPLKQKSFNETLTTFSLENYSAIGLYRIYHNAIIKKIYTLINYRLLDKTFPLTLVNCFRTVCDHSMIVNKETHGGRRNCLCVKCKIADICTLCGKCAHLGKCDNRYSKVDIS